MRFNSFDSLHADQLDFVPRSRRKPLMRLVFSFGITIAIIALSAYVPFFAALDPYVAPLSIAVLTVLCLSTAYRIQMNLDLVMAAEFQNMVFAKALSVGTSFCMIVNRDGTIIHASDGLDDIFPGFDYAQSQALTGVFEHGTVRRADRERLMGAIYSGTSDRIVFPVIRQYQETKEFIITCEPLARPVGYSLIRGREYLGQRAGLQILPDVLSATSLEKINHLLAATPVGHYTTDAFGRFEYVNPAFESLMGYGTGEIISMKLSLSHLFSVSVKRRSLKNPPPMTMRALPYLFPKPTRTSPHPSARPSCGMRRASCRVSRAP